MEQQLVNLIPWDESENAEFAHIWLHNGKIIYNFSDKPFAVSYETVKNPHYVKPYKTPAVIKEAIRSMCKQQGTTVYYTKEIGAPWIFWEDDDKSCPELFDPAFSWRFTNENR